MSREAKLRLVQEPGKIDSLAATGIVVETDDSGRRFGRHFHERGPDGFHIISERFDL